jgi:predicted amidohydrolase YtcJ
LFLFFKKEILPFFLMLITNAELETCAHAAVRIDRGIISAIGALQPHPGEHIIDAQGGLLLPGLHDHHIHVASLAASFASVNCGPPEITTAAQFEARLRGPGTGWLRGTRYHESVAGMLDAAALDRIVPDRPVRVQHRSGRMWFLNSAALDDLLAEHAPPPGLERSTGRLFDEDAWLRRTLGSKPPSFAPVGALLARAGVTGLTDMSPANDAPIARHFAAEQARGALPQRILLAGRPSLTSRDMAGNMTLGAAKLHLHEADLPPFENAVVFMKDAHARGRPVAIHCATEVELVFALACIADAGAAPGDRIEHASVAPDSAVREIARLGLAVVTQPHFIAERGDAYLAEMEPALHAILYRLRAFRHAGVVLAAGSDAPFGGANPWASMAAATSRQTRAGAPIGTAEALTPEEALDLYLRTPDALAIRRRIHPGASADLCLLDRPWSLARDALDAVQVRATLIGGRVVHQLSTERVHQIEQKRDHLIFP